MKGMATQIKWSESGLRSLRKKKKKKIHFSFGILSNLYIFTSEHKILYFIYMPEALLFIKKHSQSVKSTSLHRTTGRSGSSISQQLRFCLWSDAIRVLLKMCFVFLDNSVSLLCVVRNGDIKTSVCTCVKKPWEITFVCSTLPVFHSHLDIKPWCRWCWDWGQSGQPSPQRPLCLCCTWGSQKWPVRCCSRGRSIPCTALYLFFAACRDKSRGLRRSGRRKARG